MYGSDFTHPEELDEERRGREALEALKEILEKNEEKDVRNLRSNTTDRSVEVWDGEKTEYHIDYMLANARTLRRLWVIIDVISNSVDDLANLSSLEAELLEQARTGYAKYSDLFNGLLDQLKGVSEVMWGE